MKKAFAAATLAIASLGFSAAVAQSSPDEKFTLTETETEEVQKPVIESGRFSHFETVEVEVPVVKNVSVCLQDKDGNDFTVSMDFILAASADDMNIDPTGKTRAEIMNEVRAQFGADEVDKAMAFIQQGWEKAMNGKTMEQVNDGDPDLRREIIAVLDKIINDERLDDSEPSFEEETGISIAVARPHIDSKPGCAP